MKGTSHRISIKNQRMIYAHQRAPLSYVCGFKMHANISSYVGARIYGWFYFWTCLKRTTSLRHNIFLFFVCVCARAMLSLFLICVLVCECICVCIQYAEYLCMCVCVRVNACMDNCSHNMSHSHPLCT